MFRLRQLTVLFCLLALFENSSFAQLCTGSLGDPVVNITFGAGSNPGPSLSGTTNMQFNQADCPNDGQYTIRNNTSGCFGNAWYNLTEDHTPGDNNGYFMLINASFTPSDFYVQKVTGLCSNTTYEFASWIMNVINYTNSILPDITFSIEKEDGTILATSNSGPLNVSSSAQWKQYGFFFTTPANINTVVIRMRNNAPGGNGNDLALDDITFRPCGPQVDAKINSTSGVSTEVCEGPVSNIPLSATISTGYTSPVFQWQELRNNTWTDISSATTTSYTASVSEKGAYRYRLTVAETGNLGITGCRIASNEIRINVNPKPSITLVDTVSACEDAPLRISAEINFNGPAVSPNWTGNFNTVGVNVDRQINGVTNTGTIVHTDSRTQMPEAGYYFLEASNQFGCVTKDSIAVTVLSKPTVQVSTSPIQCAGIDLQFFTTASVNAPDTIKSYNWMFGDGTNSIVKDPVRRYNQPGNYTEEMYVTASNGCKSNDYVITFGINQLPVANFGLPEVCLADPFAQFTDSSTISDGTQSLLKYAWTFGDPNANGINPNTSTDKDARHRYTQSGEYIVGLSVTSVFGCSSDTSKTFTVNGSVPKSVFSVLSEVPFCSSSDLVIKDGSSVDFGSITRVEIYWDYNSDPTIKTVDEDPFSGKEYRFNYNDLINTDQKDFLVKYIAYSGINCVSESEQLVKVYRSPDVTFNSINGVCENTLPFLIGGVTESTGIQGDGLFTGTGVTGEGVFDPVAAGNGVQIITYTYTTKDGCVNSQTQGIEVFPQPGVDAGPDRQMVVGGVITISPELTGNNLLYNWSPVAGIQNPTDLNIKVSPGGDMQYILSVQSGDGCFNSDTLNVFVKDFLAIPNAFTPNGDGKNDTWRIPYLESIPDYDLKIFNRYGQIVFRSKASAVNWDGTMNGKQLDTGTYIYTLDRKTFGPPLQGVIHLIR